MGMVIGSKVTRCQSAAGVVIGYGCTGIHIKVHKRLIKHKIYIKDINITDMVWLHEQVISIRYMSYKDYKL
jgi:hypothetical protein